MNETHVTVVGNLVTAVDTHRFADGGVVANFRVASTERRYDRASGGWGNGDTLYMDVVCRRRLADNAAASLVKGDPVVVTGRLYTREYEHEGRRRSTVTLEAHSVAADLCWCTAVVTRNRRPSASAVEADASDVTGDPVDDVPGLVGAVPGGEA